MEGAVVAQLRRLAAIPITLVVGYYYITRLFLRIGWVHYKHLLERAVRLMRFAVVGITVFIFGNIMLIVTVTGFEPIGLESLGWPETPAYALEAIVSVQLVFLGSWFWTWRERRSETTFWRAWQLVNMYRFVSLGLNIFVFLHLWTDVFGVMLLVANVLNVVISSAWNYTAGENVIFAPGQRVRDDFELPPKAQLPMISIVVPCKRNGHEIRATLKAFVDQNFNIVEPGRLTVVLVGDPNDETWQAIRDVSEAAPLVLIEVEVKLDRRYHRRDANAKRSAGAVYVGGSDIVIFGDADIRPNRHWLWRIASLMTGPNRYHIVAGPLAGVGNSFWRHFIDRTTGITGSKTPRVPRTIELTSENVDEHKPPVTANLAVSREVLEAIGEPPPSFTWSYEDYAYVERALAAGFKVLLHPLLGVEREHREGWGRLSGEYLRSGNGCGDFLVVYPGSRFSVWRLVVLMALPVVLAAAVASAILDPVLTLAGITAVLISLMLTNLLATLQVKRIDGIVYPFIGVYFSLRFVYGVCQRFRRMGLARPVMPWVGPAHVVHGPERFRGR